MGKVLVINVADPIDRDALAELNPAIYHTADVDDSPDYDDVLAARVTEDFVVVTNSRSPNWAHKGGDWVILHYGGSGACAHEVFMERYKPGGTEAPWMRPFGYNSPGADS